MGDSYLLICLECKVSSWLADYEMAMFIEEHGGHHIDVLTPGMYEDLGELEKWIRRILEWPEAVEA